MIANSNFLIKDIPKLIPKTHEYNKFWKEEASKCINGHWSCGLWMPPNLYFYVNYGKILANKDRFSKSKTITTPWLRDIEWMFFRGWAEARGFSGWEDDNEYTCQYEVRDIMNGKYEGEELNIVMNLLSDNVFKKDKQGNIKRDIKNFKKFRTPREALEAIHPKSLGNPLWENQAKNFLMMGAREFGKSYMVGVGVVLWEFLFQIQWDEKNKKFTGTEIVVGAGLSDKSTQLLDKTRLALNNLDGGIEYAGVYYPPPFYKESTGSWNPGGTVWNRYKKKIGDNWVERGTNSSILHRSFNNNPLAAVGSRPSVMVFEEIGKFPNLEEAYGPNVDCLKNDNNKFGSLLMLGTGGDMDGGGTWGAQKMFFDPSTYDLVEYPDLWENRPMNIGFFIPANLGIREYKKKIGETHVTTDLELAKKPFLERREMLKKGRSLAPLNDEIQYKPLVPSEVFLTSTGNIFPVALLQEQLDYVVSRNLNNKLGVFGHFNQAGEFVRKTDIRPLEEFPINSKKDLSGCIAIYEMPVDNPPYAMYVAGLDPYRQNQAVNSESVGAIYIYKRFVGFEQGYDQIVAHYIGRPNTMKDFHEQCRHLLKFYNAECLYENEINNFHQFLEQKGEEYLLTDQPDALIKEIIKDSQVNRGKGIHMVNKIKERAMLKLRDWLLAERRSDEDGKVILNLHTILDPGLLKELIMYDPDPKMNFDRVIAFCLAVLLDSYKYKIKIDQIHKEQEEDYFGKIVEINKARKSRKSMNIQQRMLASSYF